MRDRSGMVSVVTTLFDVTLDEAHALVDTIPVEAYSEDDFEIPEDDVMTWIETLKD